MRYAFMRIEVEMGDANCIKDFSVTPIVSIDANSEEEAMGVVMKNYRNLLLASDGEDGKTISMYSLSQEGKTIDWRRYNG